MEYTVIIPAYNEADSLKELCTRILGAFRSIGKESAFEIFVVNDGSTDDTPDVLKDLESKNKFIKSVTLRKNMGKSFALTAGFLNTNSDYIITMDADLQDSPEDIPAMISKIGQGYDLVTGWKQDRQDSVVRVMGSKAFNSMVSHVGGVKLHDFNCGFKIYRLKVIKNISVYGQHHRFIPLLTSFMGFRVAEMPISHTRRKYGKSKYRTFRYQGFFDLLSILFTYKYRFSPLYFFGVLGMIFILPSLAVLFFIVVKHIIFVIGMGEDYIGKARLLLPLSFTVLLSGINIFIAGFVCDFILYHQSRKRSAELMENMIEERN